MDDTLKNRKPPPLNKIGNLDFREVVGNIRIREPGSASTDLCQFVSRAVPVEIPRGRFAFAQIRDSGVRFRPSNRHNARERLICKPESAPVSSKA